MTNDEAPPRSAAPRAGLELRREGDAIEVEARDPELATAFDTVLRQAFHNRDLAAIATAVAHDLRAPINTMAVQLAVMEEAIAARPEGEAGARERRRVALLQEELARLGRQLEALFSQLAAEDSGLGEIDLRQPVGELAFLLAAVGRKRQISVTHSTGEEPAPIVASRWSLRQALLRLGLLALARMPSCSELRLAIETEDETARLILAAAALDGAPLPPPRPSERPLEIHPGAGLTAPLHSAQALLVAQGATLRVLRDGFSIEFLLYRKGSG